MTEQPDPADKTAIRDAATVILLRRDAPDGVPRVLMGQRGAGAAFMPSKFVFPGGAVDAADRTLARMLETATSGGAAQPLAADPRLAAGTGEGLAPALALAAVRELWEETGLALATPTDSGVPDGTDLPVSWKGFFARGWQPRSESLNFIFRAITPPGRPRRFDARFFLAEADALATGPEAFETIDHELSHLSWLTLTEARDLDLPFITEVVLAEIDAITRAGGVPSARPVPFFHHHGGRSFVDIL